MNSKDITSTKITKILYEKLNNYLINKTNTLTIVNIIIGDNQASSMHSEMIKKNLTKETNIKVNNPTIKGECSI